MESKTVAGENVSTIPDDDDDFESGDGTDEEAAAAVGESDGNGMIKSGRTTIEFVVSLPSKPSSKFKSISKSSSNRVRACFLHLSVLLFLGEIFRYLQRKLRK